ncbi:hypothetical protein OTK49_02790 [Vibrio coralliirubri]|uniref:hypothetical protein n=1 Tax=Vibrio coralliirubri TaxID=1516159 RepID=UPI002283C584|nr:hypothetical protein [Vibrio coralliirubri]MCY9861445.1 hypothetical protein [Vibrio coralliirubri]
MNIKLIKHLIADCQNCTISSDLLIKLDAAENYTAYHTILLSISEELDLHEDIFAAKIFALNIAVYKYAISGFLLQFLVNQGNKLSRTLRMSDKDIELTAATLLSYSRKPDSFFKVGSGMSEHVELALSFQSNLNAGELILKLANLERDYCFVALRKLSKKATSSGSVILDSSVYKLLNNVIGGVYNIFDVSEETCKVAISNIVRQHEGFILAQGSSRESYRDLVHLLFGSYIDEAYILRILGSKATPAMNEHALAEFISNKNPIYRPCFDFDKAVKLHYHHHRIAVTFEERIKDAADSLTREEPPAQKRFNAQEIYMMMWAAVRYGHFSVLETINDLLAEQGINELSRLNYKVHKKISSHIQKKHGALWMNGEQVDSLNQALVCSDDLRHYTVKPEFVIKALPYIRERDINVAEGNEGDESLYSDELASLRILTDITPIFTDIDTKVKTVVISKGSIKSNIGNSTTLSSKRLKQVQSEIAGVPISTKEMVISDDYLCALSYLGAFGLSQDIKHELKCLYGRFFGKNFPTYIEQASDRLDYDCNQNGELAISVLAKSLIIHHIPSQDSM